MSDYEKLKKENPRVIYYILDWKDLHIFLYTQIVGEKRLKDLTRQELLKVYNEVVNYDTNFLING